MKQVCFIVFSIPPIRIPLILTVFFFALTGCTIQKPPVPVGIFPKELPKEPDPDASAAQVPAGYKVEVFMKDLVWPTSIDFDESGNAYVAEAGYAYRTSGNVESLTFLSIIVTFCKTA
jgi:hypothetical protein